MHDIFQFKYTQWNINDNNNDNNKNSGVNILKYVHLLLI